MLDAHTRMHVRARAQVPTTRTHIPYTPHTNADAHMNMLPQHTSKHSGAHSVDQNIWLFRLAIETHFKWIRYRQSSSFENSNHSNWCRFAGSKNFGAWFVGGNTSGSRYWINEITNPGNAERLSWCGWRARCLDNHSLPTVFRALSILDPFSSHRARPRNWNHSFASRNSGCETWKRRFVWCCENRGWNCEQAQDNRRFFGESLLRNCW